MLGSSAVSVRFSLLGSGLAIAFALLGGGCSGGSSDPPATEDPDTGSDDAAGETFSVDPRFDHAPNSEVNSTSGALHVALRTSPFPAVLGPTAFELTVTDVATGAPVDGLTLNVTPWMPAHGHGSIPKPIVTPTGNGRYATTTTNISMAGKWILKINITGGTLAAADYAEPFLNAK